MTAWRKMELVMKDVSIYVDNRTFNGGPHKTHSKEDVSHGHQLLKRVSYMEWFYELDSTTKNRRILKYRRDFPIKFTSLRHLQFTDSLDGLLTNNFRFNLRHSRMFGDDPLVLSKAFNLKPMLPLGKGEFCPVTIHFNDNYGQVSAVKLTFNLGLKNGFQQNKNYESHRKLMREKHKSVRRMQLPRSSFFLGSNNSLKKNNSPNTKKTKQNGETKKHRRAPRVSVGGSMYELFPASTLEVLGPIGIEEGCPVCFHFNFKFIFSYQILYLAIFLTKILKLKNIFHNLCRPGVE